MESAPGDATAGGMEFAAVRTAHPTVKEGPLSRS